MGSIVLSNEILHSTKLEAENFGQLDPFSREPQEFKHGKQMCFTS